MRIQFVEVSNFRKLLSVRIDISEEKTLFVGANNSGKTSAMLALRRFLSPKRCPFELFDFTLCHWAAIDAIGEAWLSQAMFDALSGGKKAEFALDVIYSDSFDALKVPTYIAEGLAWLQENLKRKQVEILPPEGSP